MPSSSRLLSPVLAAALGAAAVAAAPVTGPPRCGTATDEGRTTVTALALDARVAAANVDAQLQAGDPDDRRLRLVEDPVWDPTAGEPARFHLAVSVGDGSMLDARTGAFTRSVAAPTRLCGLRGHVVTTEPDPVVDGTVPTARMVVRLWVDGELVATDTVTDDGSPFVLAADVLQPFVLDDLDVLVTDEYVLQVLDPVATSLLDFGHTTTVDEVTAR